MSLTLAAAWCVEKADTFDDVTKVGWPQSDKENLKGAAHALRKYHRLAINVKNQNPPCWPI
ncbi:MAG: hypothetical protein U5K75_12210 [Ahrensia sp.]|nr:hypothetical protein [Ahrensia sp.]